MINFCTLFDSNYLKQGMALHRSLERHCDQFHLYIIAFDAKSEEVLVKMSLSNTTIISLRQFENPDLLLVKPTRTLAEYCWTCSSYAALYVLDNFTVDHCIYIDADIYFFSNPKILVDEMKDKSVLITEHRYTPTYDQTLVSGKYCVQFMVFKNNSRAREVLNWWKDACLEWCYNRSEDGKFGDQKYLDDWMTRFDCVHELRNLGGGVAPWNIQQYTLFKKDNQIYGKEKGSNKEFLLVFYHFHGLKFSKTNAIKPLSVYQISRNDKKFIYKTYIKEVIFLSKKCTRLDGDKRVGLIRKIKYLLKDFFAIQ